MHGKQKCHTDLVDRLDLDVEARLASDAIRGLAASLLDEHSKGCDLKSDTELGRRCLGRGVGKYAHLLGEAPREREREGERGGDMV